MKLLWPDYKGEEIGHLIKLLWPEPLVPRKNMKLLINKSSKELQFGVEKNDQVSSKREKNDQTWYP
jgi:hypothetical protein